MSKPLITGGNGIERVLEVVLQRAVADKMKFCHFCKVLTPKVITFKKSSDPLWDMQWICDYCLDGIKKMDWNNEGI